MEILNNSKNKTFIVFIILIFAILFSKTVYATDFNTVDSLVNLDRPYTAINKTVSVSRCSGKGAAFSLDQDGVMCIYNDAHAKEDKTDYKVFYYIWLAFRFSCIIS